VYPPGVFPSLFIKRLLNWTLRILIVALGAWHQALTKQGVDVSNVLRSRRYLKSPNAVERFHAPRELVKHCDA
jgi:hypothetical protein